MTIIGRGLLATKHVTKTIAFDGSAGNGAVGTVTIFTITGRIWLLAITAFCTEDLTEGGATATIEIGSSTVEAGLIPVINAVGIDNNDWWVADPGLAGLVQIQAAQVDVVMSENIIATVRAQAVNNGTLVFDVFYIPVTSNGALA